MDILAHVSVEQVIASYANERDDYDPKHLKRYERIITEGYSDLNINHVVTPQYARGFVSEVRSITAAILISVRYIQQGKIWTVRE